MFLVSNNTNQTEDQVLAAKAYIYTEFLPTLYPDVKKVRLRVDGAGCFNGGLQRLCQLMWGRCWGEVREESVRVCICGDGKSDLDGLFGVAGGELQRAVDAGFSYYDAETVAEALTRRGGLAKTVVAVFQKHDHFVLWSG